MSPRTKTTAAVRVAILSDTHGFLDARVAELARSCDIAVHSGDIGGAAVLRELFPGDNRIIAVRGNNDTVDKWPREEAGVLRRLPLEEFLDLPGGKLVITHGHAVGTAKKRHERLRKRYREARAIAYGHSHRLVCDFDEIPWVLNPGSAGRSRTFGGPSCLVLTACKERWHVKAFRFAEILRHN